MGHRDLLVTHNLFQPKQLPFAGGRARSSVRRCQRLRPNSDCTHLPSRKTFSSELKSANACFPTVIASARSCLRSVKGNEHALASRYAKERLGKPSHAREGTCLLWSKQICVRCHQSCVHNFVGVERSEDAAVRVCRILRRIVSSVPRLDSRQGICIGYEKQRRKPVMLK